MTSDQDLEIQQRAFEYSNIVRSTRLNLNQKKAILDAIPISRISANMFTHKPTDIGGKVEAINQQASNQDFGFNLNQKNIDNTMIAPKVEVAPNVADTGDDMNLLDLDFGGDGNSHENHTLQINNLEAPLMQNQKKDSVDLFDLDLGGGASHHQPHAHSLNDNKQNDIGLLDMDILGGGYTNNVNVPTNTHSQGEVNSMGGDFELLGFDNVVAPVNSTLTYSTGINEMSGFDNLLDLGGGFAQHSSPPTIAQNSGSFGLIDQHLVHTYSSPNTGAKQDEFEFDDFDPPSSSDLKKTVLRDENIEVRFI